MLANELLTACPTPSLVAGAGLSATVYACDPCQRLHTLLTAAWLPHVPVQPLVYAV